MPTAFCKKPLWECTRAIVAVAQGLRPADLVIRDVRLVNVCTAEVIEGTDVAVVEGRVAYVGPDASHAIGEDTNVIEGTGAYLAPGFLDGHIHVESSMLGAAEYARAVVPHGTTGIYWDPHEVANVLGYAGVDVMVQDAERTPLKAMVTIPSCVPAVPGFEDTGAEVGPADVREAMADPHVVGLGEMMDFPGVLSGSERAHGEIAETLKASKVVTGHYPVPEHDRGLNAYVGAGVGSDHESTRAEDALAKMRLGQYAQLRFGSAWHDLPNLAPAITAHAIDTRFACLVSDDSHPHTLVEDGHLDRILREAVAVGIDAVTAIQMVTINTASSFAMADELGSVAPGKCADMVLLDDLVDFRARMVVIDGEVVAEDGRPLFEVAPLPYPDWVTHSVRLGAPIEPASFAIEAPDPMASSVRARAIEVSPGSTLTTLAEVELPVVDGRVESDPAHDVLKVFVLERHRATGRRAFAFVRGFGIVRGAMASTVAHDAHNLLVVGTNDEDMALAAKTLVECGGGEVVVADGQVLGLVELPIAGLMSPRAAEEMSEAVHGLERAWEAIGCTMPSPFMTMSGLSLACIPDVRITDRGLVDVGAMAFLEPFVEEG